MTAVSNCIQLLYSKQHRKRRHTERGSGCSCKIPAGDGRTAKHFWLPRVRKTRKGEESRGLRSRFNGGIPGRVTGDVHTTATAKDFWLPRENTMRRGRRGGAYGA
jgi:hypothetical protein